MATTTITTRKVHQMEWVGGKHRDDKLIEFAYFVVLFLFFMLERAVNMYGKALTKSFVLCIFFVHYARYALVIAGL